METLFAETELVYFDTHEDLIEKIVYFNTHDDERRQIAEKGWHRTHTCYSSEPVTQFMIELLFEVPYSSDYEWKDFVFHRS
jgi:spore maturation protein CgeB